MTGYIARPGPLSVACLLFLAVLWSIADPAIASSYEAPLPAQVQSDPDLCAQVPCKAVMPHAERFSARRGSPAYVEAYGESKAVHRKDRNHEDRAEHDEDQAEDTDDKHDLDQHGAGSDADPSQGELLGYVFLSTDIVDIAGYSGKPIVTLIGMNTQGVITGVRILRHSEPILLVGIPEHRLDTYIAQYAGKFAGDRVEIGAATGEGVAIDAISGATVTVITENQVVMRSAYTIARQVGIIPPVSRPAARFKPSDQHRDWQTLIDDGSIQRLQIGQQALGMAGAPEPYIDLYFGYLNAPVIGRSILGDRIWHRLMQDLGPADHAVFIIANGQASFKGSGFVRGGIYDRIQVRQELDTYTFRDTDYQNLYGIEAKGAPAYTESGIFILRGGSFNAAYPWQLVLLANRIDQQSGAKTFVTFDREYWVPDDQLEAGRPEVIAPQPTWLRIWQAKRLDVLLLLLVLAATTVVYASRDRLVRRSRRNDQRWVSIPKYAIWICSLGFVGFYAMAQPSITQVLTWLHSLVFHWEWTLFLSDPLIFLFWWYIIATVFLWGRGIFCGWLCPYGAMTELLYKFARNLGLARFQFHLPMRWHLRLRWVKYLIFMVLVAMSFQSMGTAERMAEVEPFKSTFLVGGFWTRSWPFVAYWVALALLAVFIERPYCKYLCPLGAALAIPSSFRWYGLKRKPECLTCHACQKGCGSLAIDDDGRIDQRECLLCLECQVLYYDDRSCPPLAKERKRRIRNGLAPTPIGGDGHFIPLKTIDTTGTVGS